MRGRKLPQMRTLHEGVPIINDSPVPREIRLGLPRRIEAFAGIGGGVAREKISNLAMAQQRKDCLSERLGVSGPNQHPRRPIQLVERVRTNCIDPRGHDLFRNASDGGRHDRGATGERLEDYVWKRICARGVQVDIRGLEVTGDGDRTGFISNRAHARPRVTQGIGIGAEHNEQTDVSPRGARCNQAGGREQHLTIPPHASGMSRRGKEHVGVGWNPKRYPRGALVSGAEHRQIDAVGDHSGLFDAECEHRLLRSVEQRSARRRHVQPARRVNPTLPSPVVRRRVPPDRRFDRQIWAFSAAGLPPIAVKRMSAMSTEHPAVSGALARSGACRPSHGSDRRSK